ncbi:MAG: D-alanine--D-alanine ligase [Candidatus Dadabacteria bacterium]|nr:MAG: D-alanine--D-alanine ligase [Candidatus Dadabacteria bacterium]
MDKTALALICGGRSAEHEISLQSAANVYKAIDKTRYQIWMVWIGREGLWNLIDPEQFADGSRTPADVEKAIIKKDIFIRPDGSGAVLVSGTGEKISEKLDVIFPVLHGPYGEDGTVQGLFKILNLPFVGPGVTASALCMDKVLSKRVLRDGGILVADFVSCSVAEKESIDYDQITSRLGSPLFVKPANMGSSVGISKVVDRQSFDTAVTEAFKYDTHILIEENIEGRELECAVLGNLAPEASGVGEVVSSETHGFYSYQAKYIDADGAKIIIPADLTESERESVREAALVTYRLLKLEGMSRVDVFLRKDGSVVVNEVNTIPGFTSISMYPKLWEEAGVSYSELIDRLIELAFERSAREAALSTEPGDN